MIGPEEGLPIYIVVLNWRNAPSTVACLDSLSTVREPAFDIVVVDNGSGDGSEQYIRTCYQSVTVLQTGNNSGYAGGNNLGVRFALDHGARSVLILNNDTTVAVNALRQLLDALTADPKCGIVTPMLVDPSEPQQVWALGGTVDDRTGAVTRLHAGESSDSWKEKPPVAVDVAQGAAMLARAEVFERIGPLDESYYLYYEETDWCLQARAAGFSILAVPSARVWHHVSKTLGAASPIIDYYMLRNHLHLVARHWSGPGRWAVACRIVSRDLATIAAYTVKPHGGERTPHRNARLFALRDAALGRWGRMGDDVAVACQAVV